MFEVDSVVKMLSVDKIHEHEIKTIVVYSYMCLSSYYNCSPPSCERGWRADEVYISSNWEKKILTIINYDKTMPNIMYEQFNDPKIITPLLQ